MNVLAKANPIGSQLATAGDAIVATTFRQVCDYLQRFGALQL